MDCFSYFYRIATFLKKMIKNWFKNIGPGTLIAAAFIGPGTVTLCTIAGVNFGFNLLWAMVLSIFATIVLQEMAARLGIISQKGLSEVLREEIKNPLIELPIYNDLYEHVWHLFVIRTSQRDKLINYLKEEKIETLVHYPIPPHKQIAYKEINHLSFPETEKIHESILSLPISPVMSNEDVSFVIDVLNRYERD